ncbi:hypothetical protein, partial [Kaistella sp.]|uniref:hypothetical protein n=1 Tax=Kaistella sp. TaxID=2782235 RepID=UPI002F92A33D
MKKIYCSDVFYMIKTKKIQTFLIVLLFSTITFAQVTTNGSGDYTADMDNILTHVDKSPVTTGILYDRVMSFADLDLLKDDGYITTSNYQHFIQSWSELYRASYNPTVLNLEQLKANSQNTAATMNMG